MNLSANLSKRIITLVENNFMATFQNSASKVMAMSDMEFWIRECKIRQTFDLRTWNVFKEKCPDTKSWVDHFFSPYVQYSLMFHILIRLFCKKSLFRPKFCTKLAIIPFQNISIIKDSYLIETPCFHNTNRQKSKGFFWISYPGSWNSTTCNAILS